MSIDPILAKYARAVDRSSEVACRTRPDRMCSWIGEYFSIIYCRACLIVTPEKNKDEDCVDDHDEVMNLADNEFLHRPVGYKLLNHSFQVRDSLRRTIAMWHVISGNWCSEIRDISLAIIYSRFSFSKLKWILQVSPVVCFVGSTLTSIFFFWSFSVWLRGVE